MLLFSFRTCRQVSSRTLWALVLLAVLACAAVGVIVYLVTSQECESWSSGGKEGSGVDGGGGGGGKGGGKKKVRWGNRGQQTLTVRSFFDGSISCGKERN